jgi:hypothetical protein
VARRCRMPGRAWKGNGSTAISLATAQIIDPSRKKSQTRFTAGQFRLLNEKPLLFQLFSLLAPDLRPPASPLCKICLPGFADSTGGDIPQRIQLLSREAAK